MFWFWVGGRGEVVGWVFWLVVLFFFFWVDLVTGEVGFGLFVGGEGGFEGVWVRVVVVNYFFVWV